MTTRSLLFSVSLLGRFPYSSMKLATATTAMSPIFTLFCPHVAKQISMLSQRKVRILSTHTTLPQPSEPPNPPDLASPPAVSISGDPSHHSPVRLVPNGGPSGITCNHTLLRSCHSLVPTVLFLVEMCRTWIWISLNYGLNLVDCDHISLAFGKSFSSLSERALPMFLFEERYVHLYSFCAEKSEPRPSVLVLFLAGETTSGHMFPSFLMLIIVRSCNLLGLTHTFLNECVEARLRRYTFLHQGAMYSNHFYEVCLQKLDLYDSLLCSFVANGKRIEDRFTYNRF
ncbi:hypothetical protein AALP_AA5G158600 [Arabis alpina]|uniref:Uncharacterized protein n=1 Tax=Arabis alpina TaxID=50452 RepID=A0A087GXD3_ARAAL|nr:hypothetical protein AALP_AA5G158600 [Arabis alpina]